MEKTAETQVPIHELIRRRWSPRAFRICLWSRTNSLACLKPPAGQRPRAMNSLGLFSWHRSRTPKNYEDMLSVLVDFNRDWANKAPVLILALAHTQFEKDGRPNRHAFYDLGQAAANLALQATALGLTTHQMAGFDVEAARERFAVPEGWEPVSVIALGYAGSPDSLPEKLRRARDRPAPAETAGTIRFYRHLGTAGIDRVRRKIK